MPNFGDSAFLILLALLLFGPKKLPQLARQLGKLMADFRRASNEFRSQMEEELRISEQADRQKQVAAIEAAKPAEPAEPEAPHLPPPAPTFTSASDSAYDSGYDTTPDSTTYDLVPDSPDSTADSESEPLPIATSGDLSIMPPSTGLPIANTSPRTGTDATPAPDSPTGTESAEPAPQATPAHEAELETETLHG